jgi:hypothetical protein
MIGETDLDEYANREIRIIHDKLIETIKRTDFTCEMLNNINFHVSPVKSARKI